MKASGPTASSVSSGCTSTRGEPSAHHTNAWGSYKVASLTPIRITHRALDGGSTYAKQDDWTCKTIRELDLGRTLVGSAVFIPKIDDRNGEKVPARKYIGGFYGLSRRRDYDNVLKTQRQQSDMQQAETIRVDNANLSGLRPLAPSMNSKNGNE